jgi:DNA polymerase-3 subunit epsilon|tara:strand:- start:308 stop:937 length:630 start_codon:yes stop_codon:yes gene_type:complete
MNNSEDRMKAPFNEASFACFDFETTGFSPKRDRVIEVAVVTVTHGTVGPSWTSLINPGDDVELGATHIHGIKRDWIRSAPSFAEIAGTLFSLLDGKVLVAHNANFDLGFLRSEMSRAQLLAKGTLFPHWDTMKAADFAPSLPASRKLVDVAAAFGVEIANAHQALDDALAVAEIVAEVTETIGSSISFNTFSGPDENFESCAPVHRPNI